MSIDFCPVVDTSWSTLEQYRRELMGTVIACWGLVSRPTTPCRKRCPVGGVRPTVPRAGPAGAGRGGTGSPSTSAWKCCVDGSGGRCGSTCGCASLLVEALLGGLHPDRDLDLLDRRCPRSCRSTATRLEIVVAWDTYRLAFATGAVAPAGEAAGDADPRQAPKTPGAEAATTLGTSVAVRPPACCSGPGRRLAAPPEETAAVVASTGTRASRAWPVMYTRSSETTWTSWSCCRTTTRRRRRPPYARGRHGRGDTRCMLEPVAEHLPGLDHGAGGRGLRCPGVGAAAQTHLAWAAMRRLGAAGARGAGGRADQPHDFLPGH